MTLATTANMTPTHITATASSAVGGGISVVVCAYTERRWDDLIAAIRSLQRQTLVPREIILVIDHNPTLLAKAREQFKGISLIENGQPRGLSGARNSGIVVAQGDIIAFMDEDAEAAPNWLENLAAHYADANVMAVLLP